jgi:two-component system response regulator HydG
MVGACPDISDLASRLRFSANEGRIWLDDMRMILMHVSGLAALRRGLIANLGTVEASDLLFRIGYASRSVLGRR